MINESHVTIDDLEKYFTPKIWDTYDKITNLSDETVGFYAYKLQELFIGQLSNLLIDDNVLVDNPLEKITYPMQDIKITYNVLGETQGLALHNFSLFFRIWHKGVGRPVILRNGYLLKCLKEAGIEKIEELNNYKAVLIYNNANVNPDICSFVKFEKL